MNMRQTPLFQQFPLTGRATLSTGQVPTPYHIYDGYGAFIGGTVDLAAVQRLLQPETVTPMQTADGRALMGIWLFNPVGVVLSRNATAQAMTKNATNNVRYFDPARDTLTISASPYHDLGFQPHVVQHMSGFKFVYLNPM